MNKVSVVIPAYNNENCLGRAISSVLAQSVPPLEVIIVNDGSKDGTLDVARSYGDRVIVIDQKNKGPAAARNAGMQMAKGEYIALLDADDFWLPEFIEKTANFLASHRDCPAVSVGWRSNEISGNTAECPSNQNLKEWVGADAGIIKDFFLFWAHHDHVRTGSVLFRKSALDLFGGQLEDLRISEDLEFWAMLAMQGDWGFIPEVLWVCDSEIVSAKTGWLKHFRLRQKLCPSIDQWQHRLVKHGLEKNSGFIKLRGRVARGYAHAQFLAGRSNEAKLILHQYGKDFGNDRLSKFMMLSCKGGFLGCFLIGAIIRLRERIKSLKASIVTR